MCGTVRWSGGSKCCTATLCPAMSSQPRRSAYRATDRVTEDTVRAAAAAAPPPACDAERAVAAVLVASVPPPPPLQPFQLYQPYRQPQQQPERMQVRPAQPPRGEGSGATSNRRERRAHGGNRRGRERRLFREFAPPAAAAAAPDGAAPRSMLRESSNGEDGATPPRAPLARPRHPPRAAAPGGGDVAARPAEPCPQRRGLRRGQVLGAGEFGVVGLRQPGHAVSAAAAGICGAPLVGAGGWACGRPAAAGHGCGNPVCPLYASPHRRSAELDMGTATWAWEPAERVRACVAGGACPEMRPRVRVAAVRWRTQPPCSVRCGTACQ